MAGLLGGGDERVAQLVRLALVRHRLGPADTVELARAARLVLGAEKVGQHVVVTPADVAELAPAVEVLALAADIDQAVDRAGAAEHASARLEDAPALELGLRLGGVAPVDLGVVEQLAVA